MGTCGLFVAVAWMHLLLLAKEAAYGKLPSAGITSQEAHGMQSPSLSMLFWG